MVGKEEAGGARGCNVSSAEKTAAQVCGCVLIGQPPRGALPGDGR